MNTFDVQSLDYINTVNGIPVTNTYELAKAFQFEHLRAKAAVERRTKYEGWWDRFYEVVFKGPTWQGKGYFIALEGLYELRSWICRQRSGELIMKDLEQQLGDMNRNGGASRYVYPEVRSLESDYVIISETWPDDELELL